MGDTRREQLAALPFVEKLKILEKLRARSLAIAAAGLRGSEFKTEEEEDKLAEILKDILSGAPDVPLLRQARDNLDRVAPKRN